MMGFDFLGSSIWMPLLVGRSLGISTKALCIYGQLLDQSASESCALHYPMTDWKDGICVWHRTENANFSPSSLEAIQVTKYEATMSRKGGILTLPNGFGEDEKRQEKIAKVIVGECLGTVDACWGRREVIVLSHACACQDIHRHSVHTLRHPRPLPFETSLLHCPSITSQPLELPQPTCSSNRYSSPLPLPTQTMCPPHLPTASPP